ncbi:HAMP domain-containing sensor histidine kinase [uncultured Parabacteroides sp.]|jgi:signal transduction histidine kinase|uniref:sensor histidine kinase n=1 Tax=uncultured Parabacteroides sp. TaxID=512312 RepID=UPI0025FF5519|nr:HAMP domain-containing sensor histidine kinase [uncultured Parabacteroides sp.]
MKKTIFIFFLLLFTNRILHAQMQDKDNYILILHSINFNETWTQETYETIRDTFSKDGLMVKGEELQIPAMRNITEVYDKITELKDKYSSPPKAIVCIGDPAWLICQPLFDNEWKEVPAVICYSRKLSPSKIEYLLHRDIQDTKNMVPTEELINKYNVTTITQPLYTEETIRLIKQLQPELKKIVFIRDERYISICAEQELSDTMKTHFPDLQLEILSSPSILTETLLETLSIYGKETGIIYYSWFLSKENDENQYLRDNVQKIINSFSNSPIYILTDLNPESGNFAGGHYISVKDFSTSVVSTISLILNGKPARDIHSHIGGSPQTYLNYQHLFRNGIPPVRFPQHAVYYQQPPTFFQKYQIHLISALAIIGLLSMIAVLRFRLYMQKLKQDEERREKEKAEEANHLKSAFLANMSHEIRTPLNAIVGFSNLIAHSESPEDTLEFCKIIETNNELLLQLINDILDLSKIEAGQLEFSFSNIDVSSLFLMLAQTHQTRTKEGVTLECILPEKPCFIHSEKIRLTQVMTNFLTNACKFTFEGSIRMGYEEIDGGLRFYVSDTGKGIARENIPHVFERFAKFDLFIQGTGLGLSICQTIVNRLNGEIGVESEEGKGTTFWFTIPCEVHYEEYITSVSEQ